MSVLFLLLGLLAFFDAMREPARERASRRAASFTAAGERFASPGGRLLRVGFFTLGAGLLAVGGWAFSIRTAENGADGSTAVGFGLFLVACAVWGAPRDPDLFFGPTRVRVGLRAIPYEDFRSFAVDESGRVSLVGDFGRIAGRAEPEEAPRLRAFLSERVVVPGPSRRPDEA